jgi:hypothetical protein
MGYESKQTKNPGVVEDKELNAVSIYTTNPKSGLTTGCSRCCYIMLCNTVELDRYALFLPVTNKVEG